MSQRFYQSGQYEVLTGWDRPLQQFFLTVFDTSVPEDVDEGYVVYSNLDDPEAMRQCENVDYFLQRLGALSLPIPNDLRADLQEDRARDAGNLRHDYGRIA